MQVNNKRGLFGPPYDATTPFPTPAWIVDPAAGIPRPEKPHPDNGHDSRQNNVPGNGQNSHDDGESPSEEPVEPPLQPSRGVGVAERRHGPPSKESPSKANPLGEFNMDPRKYAELIYDSLPGYWRPLESEKDAWIDFMAYYLRSAVEDEERLWRAALRLARMSLPNDAENVERVVERLRSIDTAMPLTRNPFEGTTSLSTENGG